MRILRLHLLEHQPVSARCDQEGIHPILFYQWPKAFVENGTAAFARSSRPDSSALRRDQLVESLETKLKRKDEVIAIIAEDLIRKKKVNGASSKTSGSLMTFATNSSTSGIATPPSPSSPLRSWVWAGLSSPFGFLYAGESPD